MLMIMITIRLSHLGPRLHHPSLPRSHRPLEQSSFSLLALKQIPMIGHPIHHSVKLLQIANEPWARPQMIYAVLQGSVHTVHSGTHICPLIAVQMGKRRRRQMMCGHSSKC